MYAIDDLKFIALIEKGIPIERLEMRLKPEFGLDDFKEETKKHDGYADFSDVGFLGIDEKLLELIHSDWKIVEEAGTTHKEIADALDNLIKIGYEEASQIMESWNTTQYKIFDKLGLFKILPKKFKKYLKIREEVGESEQINGLLNEGYSFTLPSSYTFGEQSCPWGCGYSGQNAGVIHKINLTKDQEMEILLAQSGGIQSHIDSIESLAKEIGEDHECIAQLRRLQENSKKDTKTYYAPLTGLLPHLIRKHYFFEGKESIYRADPRFLIKALNLSKN